MLTPGTELLEEHKKREEKGFASDPVLLDRSLVDDIGQHRRRHKVCNEPIKGQVDESCADGSCMGAAHRRYVMMPSTQNSIPRRERDGSPYSPLPHIWVPKGSAAEYHFLFLQLHLRTSPSENAGA